MNSISVCKGMGYLVSTLSVLLLAMVSWKATSGDSSLRLCLITGGLSSVTGMALRWTSHRMQQEKERASR